MNTEPLILTTCIILKRDDSENDDIVIPFTLSPLDTCRGGRPRRPTKTKQGSRLRGYETQKHAKKH